MTDAEMVEWCEGRARMWRDSAADEAASGWHSIAEAQERTACAFAIAAAALRWYTLTETGGDDHAARQAIIAACKEATR